MIERLADGFDQTGEAHELGQVPGVNVEQFTTQQLRLAVQHKAEEQHHAQALRLVLTAIRVHPIGHDFAFGWSRLVLPGISPPAEQAMIHDSRQG